MGFGGTTPHDPSRMPGGGDPERLNPEPEPVMPRALPGGVRWVSEASEWPGAAGRRASDGVMAAETWEPAMELRTARPVPEAPGRVQQLWRSNYGHTEWRDIPEVAA